MAVLSLIFLISLVQAFVPCHAADASTAQPTQFEISMRRMLELPEELRRQHADRILAAASDGDRELEGGDAGGLSNRRVLQNAGVKLGLSAPPLNSGPSMATVNMSFYRWESVTPPPVVDWRKNIAITPILTQYVCSSCWAIAAVDTIAIMWAIPNNSTGANLSPQQVCDCATKQCCQGGWPEWAFSYVLFNGGITTNANYPYTALDSATCLLDTTMSTAAQITGWELVPAFNAMALMKAVSMQPVVAFISASAADFTGYSSNGVLNIYNGLCTTDVNHAVVVVGFNYTGPDLKGSYWIIKNSWYATWGDRGYMYLAMTPDVRGKCGILSTPAMYPVYFPSGQQPARFASDKGGKWKINKVDDLSSSLFSSTLSTTTTTATTLSPTLGTTCAGMINPCGGGGCYVSGGVPRCNCSALANFVEMPGLPTSKCVPRSPCTTAPVNPCGGGSCSDVGDGTYTCACTAGYAVGAAVDGSPTCVPAAGLAKSYVTNPGDNCTFVATSFNISTTSLTSLNSFINCSVTEYLPPGIALTVSAAVTSLSSYCTNTYTVRPSDTCTSVANTFFNGSLTSLMAINPGLSCKRLFKSQQICLQMVTASTTSSAPQCGQSVPVVIGDTCTSVAAKYSVDSVTFASLNPGVNCSNLAVGSYVCVAPSAPATTINCTGWYRVMQGDTCPSIWNGANLTMSMFLSINPGIQCQAPYLVVGQQVCIDSPLLTTMQRNPNANYSIYTVRAGDTLSTISTQYLTRCTLLSVSPAAIAAQNFILNASAPLPVGLNLIIPCIGGIVRRTCKMGDRSRLMAAANAVLLTALPLAFMPRHATHASTQFEISMGKTMELPVELRRQHADRILEAARDAEREFEGGGGGGRRGGRVLVDTGVKLGLSAPPLNSGPSMATVNMSFYRWESVTPPPVVDWRKTVAITPIQTQYVVRNPPIPQCVVPSPLADARPSAFHSPCWAIAAVDSIAIMWAIANNATGTNLSPQQVCDCATKQCCQGGWPEWAFSYVLFNGGITTNANYPYLAYDSATCLLDTTMPSVAQITGWELVPAFNAMALMKAVSMQPVVAFISASAPDFTVRRPAPCAPASRSLSPRFAARTLFSPRFPAPTVSWFPPFSSHTFPVLPRRSNHIVFQIPAFLRSHRFPICVSIASDLPRRTMYESPRFLPSLSTTLPVQAYASRDTVNIYNGLCTTDVNHAVVVVGFNYTGPDLKGSYWIIKNSWYATWADRGYMYLAMTPDVRGKCGILSTPAMYPVYFPSGQQPARFVSDKRGKWKITKVDDLSSSLFSSTLSTTTNAVTIDNITTMPVDYATVVSLNPAANCNGSLAVGSSVCVASKSAVASLDCTGWYRVMQGDTCPSIWNGANLTMSMFLTINPGIQCQAPYLVVGQQVCIDSPPLTTMQRNPNANYSIYTVRPNDTLSTISTQYLPRCTLLSISPAAIAAQNFIPNASAPLPIGTNLIIPCIAGIGMIDGSCATSLTVCGSDFVSYPSYCHATVNYALPIINSGPCDKCAAACPGRMGLPPLPGFGCTQAICPYPTWFGGSDCTLAGPNTTFTAPL
ncbi:unnamed protein product [Closterium sp. Yama58-4]|nr:unnamed protein product [Closterium sp. Yama58-4]